MRKDKFCPCLATAAVAVGLLAPLAEAAVVTYDNRTDWLSAVSTVVATIDFTAQASGTSGFTYYNTAAGLTVADVNFVGYTSDGFNLYVLNPAYQTTFNRGTGPMLAGGYSPGYIVATLPGLGAYAVAFDFSTLSTPKQVTIQLSTGETFSLTSNANNTMKFFGFTSDTPVTSVRVSATNTTALIDNFSYGNPVGSEVPEPVKEPGTLLLGLTGATGIWLARRMRRRLV